MTRHTFLATLLAALLSTAAFSQSLYVITGSGQSFAVAKDGTEIKSGTIAEVLAAIKSDVGNNTAVSIKFGNGSDVLDIGTESAQFSNTGGTWGNISLSGKITSANTSYNQGAVNIQTGVSVESTADIENTSSTAIYKAGTGTVSISDGTVSAAGSYGVYNSSTGTVNISGGTVSAGSYGVYNSSTGTVNISGGTVSSTGGYGNGVYNSSTGKVTVSGNAVVTSASNTTISNYNGTIEILGGTVANTASNGTAVRINYANGSLVLGGSPKISGNIRGFVGKFSVNSTFTPGEKVYALMFDGTVAGGDVAVTGGANYISNFAIANEGWSLIASGSDLAVSILGYAYAKAGTKYTITKETGATSDIKSSIQSLIDAIKTDVGNNTAVSIQFGNGSDVLDIGTEAVQFNNDGGTWGNITLSGKITSAIGQSAVSIQTGVSVEITGDIANTNTSSAISKNGTGKVTISGNAVVTSAGNTTISNYNGTIEILGGTVANTASNGTAVDIGNGTTGSLVLGGSPTISGNIRSYAGKLSVNNTFAPGEKVYTITLDNNNYVTVAGGDIAVTGGAAHIGNFAIADEGWSLIASGSDLAVSIQGYAYTKAGTKYTIAKETGSASNIKSRIQPVIEAIRTDANGTDISIQFGDGNNVLDIGEDRGAASFDNTTTTGGTWGKITLSGKIKGGQDNGLVFIGTGVSVESTADIANPMCGSYTMAINNSGTVIINGGTVVGRVWVRNTLVLGGSPAINGRIDYNAGLSVNSTFAPGEKVYTLLTSTVAAGDVVVTGGAAFINNFTLDNGDYQLKASNGDLVAEALGYNYAKDGTKYTITQTNTSYTYANIQAAINAIRTDANGMDVSIQFGDGTKALNIGGSERFENSSGETWGKITLSGKIKGPYAELYIGTGVSLESTADIAVLYDGTAINKNGTGKVTVSGNAVVTSGGQAAIRSYGGTIEILGGTVEHTASCGYSRAVQNESNSLLILGGSPTIIGNIRGYAEKQSVDNTFAPGEKTYTLMLDGTVKAGDVAVTGGAEHIANFRLANEGWGLVASGKDLVLNEGAPTIYYTVTFKDYDGTVIGTPQTVEHGSSATAPANPTRAGYTFTGWDKTFNNVTSNLTVTALYEAIPVPITTYTVTFVSWDGVTVLKTETVEQGSAATAPAIPERAGYTFTGWNVEFSSVASDLTVTALYEAIPVPITTYTVTFVGWDGTTVLKTETVEHGSAATAPTAPERAGYTFTGWNVEFSSVASDLIVTAVYEEIQTPILSSKIAGGNLLTQTVGGINLTAKTSTTIAVYNLNGELISRQNYNAGNYSISFGHLPKGVYIVRARFNKGIAGNASTETLRLTVR